MQDFDFRNIRIGTDIVEVSRFRNFDERSRLAKNIFTRKEIEECQKKKNPAESLAARFAAKEAVRKTIEENIKFNEMEIRSARSGAPQVIFLNKKIKDKYKSIVSISHTEFIAQAVCLTYKKSKTYGN